MIDFDLQDIVRNAVDDTFAERVKHQPQKDGRADPSRAQAEFEAVLRVAGQRTKPLGEGWNISLASSKNTLWVDAKKYPAIQFKARDIIRSMDRAGQPFFEILAIYPRGEMRVMLELGLA